MKITQTTNNLADAATGTDFWIYEIETPQGVRWTYARDAGRLKFPGKALETQQTWASKHGARRGLSTHYHHREIKSVTFSPPPMPLVTEADKDDRMADRMAERIAARTGEPATQVETINVTPTWSSVLVIMLTAYENGTTTGRKIATEELRRMAQAADRYNAMVAAEREAFMAGHAAGEEGICGTPTDADTEWQDYQKGKNNG